MTFEDARRLFEWLWDATEDQVQKFIAKMTAAGLLRLDAGFELWAHESQLPPFGEGWRVCLMMAGRGFGKTRAGAEWIHRLASGKRGLRMGAEPGAVEMAQWKRGAIVFGRSCRRVERSGA